ncbi:MAG: carbohydrate ABC transporter permease [Candidatus Bipolaricaulia bacterium]
MQRMQPRSAIFKASLFFLPALLVIVVFFFIPVVITTVMGFTDMDFRFQWDFIGLDNYKKMAKDFLIWPIDGYLTQPSPVGWGVFILITALLVFYFVRYLRGRPSSIRGPLQLSLITFVVLAGVWFFIQALSGQLAKPNIIVNTVVYVLGTLFIFNTTFGLILAILTTSIGRRAGTFFRAVWLLPRFTPPVVYGIIWLALLQPSKRGMFNAAREFFGLEPLDWITAHPWGVIIVTGGFIGASMGMIIFAAAIDSIPEDYRRAAKVDGASWFQEIRYIILPLIRWPLLFITAYQTLSLLTSFEYILIITSGGPFFASSVWSLYAYKLAFDAYSGTYAYGYGAALATILVVIGIIASVVYWRIFKFKEMMAEPKIEVT